MRPVSLDAALLQKLVPSLVLRPEAILAARIVEREGGRGTLALMGQLVEAALPDDLEPGTHLRLQVQEATPERVVLRVVDQQVVLAPPVNVPLPNGQAARVTVEGRDAGGGPDGDVSTVALSFESVSLGRLDLRLTLARGTLTANVAAAAGPPFDAVDAAAAELLNAIESTTGLPATVRIAPRYDPFETYA